MSAYIDNKYSEFSPIRTLEGDSDLAKRGRGETYTASSVSFPQELDNISHWVTFRAFQTKQIDRTQDSEEIPVYNIRLPVPGNLGTAYNINYSEPDLGAVQQTIIDALGNSPDTEDARGAGKALATGALAGAITGLLVGTNPTKAAMMGAYTGGAVNVLSGNQTIAQDLASATIQQIGPLGSAAAAQFGVAVNPHKVVLFESVGFRRHSFNYEFIPQNRKESEALRKVIRFFKLAASPSLNPKGNIDFGRIKFGEKSINLNFDVSGGKHFFKYPEYFRIEFHHKNFLFGIGPSFLESIDIQYHPAGIPSYTREVASDDPAPTAVRLGLSFKETEIVTKEAIMRDDR